MAQNYEDPRIASGRHWYIHNTFGTFYRGLLNWFGNYFYDRFKYRIIATYEKSIELFNKRLEFDKELNNMLFPAITLDPSFDFDFAEGIGQTMWQKPYIAPNMVPDIWLPIEGLSDQDVQLSIIFSRFQGTIELTFWLNSVYELLDTRMELLLFSGGLNRYMRPEVFQSFLVIPEDIINYEIDEQKIDWSNTDLVLKLLKAPNVYKYTLPVVLDPIFKFTGINDNSVKYGNDSLTEYKLSATVEYEINIPTYCVLKSRSQAILVLNMYTDITYSKYGTATVYNEETNQYEQRSQLDFVPKMRMANEGEFNDPANLMKATDYSYYKFTEEDVSDFETIGEVDYEGILLPNPYIDKMEDGDDIIVVSYPGKLTYQDDWLYEDNKSQILIKIKPILDEIVEFHFYKKT